MEAKRLTMSVCAGLLVFGMAALPSAYATDAASASSLRVIEGSPPAHEVGKTRAQAREELLIAWCDGTLQHDASDVNYPYSAESIERTRSLRAGKPIPGVKARCR